MKTTNPIESIFATVKLRANAARRIKPPLSALYLLFQLIMRAQNRWRCINAPHLVTKVLYGVRLRDEIEVREEKRNVRLKGTLLEKPIHTTLDSSSFARIVNALLQA